MRRKVETAVKASESVVSRLLAKTLGENSYDTVEEVVGNFYLSGPNYGIRKLLAKFGGLYPWVTNVARDVMSESFTPLTEHLMFVPSATFLVKDSERSGADSLWLAAADIATDSHAALQDTEHRGLTRAFRLPNGDISHVIAIQLTSFRF
jgi:hypothetical protein